MESFTLPRLQADDFELFGLPMQFAQDRHALDARWKDLQRHAHPDRFAAEGATAQRLAMQWSVRINQAYQRLRDPLQRGAYLCELRGHPVSAESNTAMPAAFLMQQMQWRENLEEAQSVDALQVLRDEVKATEQRLFNQLEQALDAQPDPALAVAQVRSLMFIERFARDLDARLDELES
jgi:molecular chaperone HscB